MNTLASTIPARTLEKDHSTRELPRIPRALIATRASRILTPSRTVTAALTAPAPAAESTAPDLQTIWRHTVKRAREGSPFHRQTLALLDRGDRLAIESACGSWRS
ncbi:MAG TPA: hypothetical protein VMU78_09910 [Methylocella sp.]|nr:hypothetical protein [Methylocella sp.]